VTVSVRGRRIGGSLKLLALASVLSSTLAHATPGIFPPEPSKEEAANEEGDSGETATESVHGAALVRRVPDLVTRPWPPRLHVTLGLAVRSPLQDFGTGIGLAGFPTDWLRLSIDYAICVSSNGGRDDVVSNYAEGIASFKVLGVDSSTVKDVLRVDRVRPQGPRRDCGSGAWDVPCTPPTPRPVFRAVLPSHHALLVEAGALTATMPLQRCIARCELVIAEGSPNQRASQLVYVFGGLRYLYNTNSRSEKWRLLDHAREAHAFAHVIARPFNDWPEARYYKSSYRLKRAPLGFRAGFVVPFCGRRYCPYLSVTLGFLPVPRAPLVESSLGF
jgi:hypothetical protein